MWAIASSTSGSVIRPVWPMRRRQVVRADQDRVDARDLEDRVERRRAPRGSRSGCSRSRRRWRRPCRPPSGARSLRAAAARSRAARPAGSGTRPTAFSTSATVRTWGITTPLAPASRACMIRTGSLAATRYRTGTCAARVAITIWTRSEVATGPCSPSATSRSKPLPASSSGTAGRAGSARSRRGSRPIAGAPGSRDHRRIGHARSLRAGPPLVRRRRSRPGNGRSVPMRSGRSASGALDASLDS